jgi:predicted amidohydrolase YtcJ
MPTRADGMPPTSPWQRLSVAEIFDAYTINGARSLGRDTEIGSLESGRSADQNVPSTNAARDPDRRHLERSAKRVTLHRLHAVRRIGRATAVVGSH